MLNKLLAGQSSTSLRHRIVRSVAGSFGMKVGSLGIAFITNVLLTRTLGADGYGAYVYAFTWAGFLSILPGLGLAEYVIREVAVYQAKSEWGLLQGLLRWSNFVTLLLATATAILSAIGGWVLGIDTQSSTFWVFCIALFVIPIGNLTALRQAAMKGLNWVVLGDFPELLVRPILFIALISIAHLVLGNGLSAVWAMGLYIVSVSFSYAIGAWLLQRALPEAAKVATPVYQSGVWLRSTLPFLMVVCMFVINQQTDVLMLGAIKGVEAAGIYTVVLRGAQLIQFALSAVCSATGPTIANLYATQNISQLKRLMRGSTRLLVAGSLAITLTLILFGHLFLGIFGSEFVQGRAALTILAIGYFLDASTGGLAGLMLIMSGNERDIASATGVTAGLNVALNALLIPQWGLEGAAIATTISMISRSIFFMICMYRKVGFFPNPFF